MVNAVTAMTAVQGNEGSWESASGALATLLSFGPWVFALLVAAVVVRALLRNGRYRARRAFPPRAQEAVRAAVRAAERRTIGEIVPVVVERSDGHGGACWLAALTTLLLGSALLEAVLPWSQPALLLLCQLGLGALGFALALLLPDVRRTFVSGARATEMAEEQALQEFYRLGLHETEGHTGVLLFVSLLERRVVVLADRGIHSAAGPLQWEGARDAVLEGIRAGSLERGLAVAIGRVGDVLAMHAPWKLGDRNELPDRVIVRRD